MSEAREGLPTGELTPELLHDLLRGRERTPFYEMAAEGEPHEVVHAVRMRCEWLEEELVIEGRFPQTYPSLLMDQEIRERERALRFSYPLGLAEWPKNLKEKGYDKDPKKRKELVETLSDAHDEMKARLDLVTKLNEQLAYSADVENYLFQYFIRLGKFVLPSADYGIIFNLKETHEGFIPFGHKVKAALDALREIGAGKAKITLENGKTKRLPNIWGLPPNRGLVNFAIDRYVLPKLKGLREETALAGKPEELEELEEFDDRAAATLALGLFRHFDYDVYYCFGRKGGGESFSRQTIAPEDWALMNLEIGAATGDSAKAMFFPVRRAAEWGRIEPGGAGRREHPREAGIPMSFGCYPMLTTHMLDIVTTQMPLTPEMIEQVREQVGISEGAKAKYDEGERVLLLEEKDEEGELKIKAKFGRKIDISVHDRCYEDEIEILVKVEEEGKEEEKPIVLSYPRIPLWEIKWDDVELINADTEEEWFDFAMGPQTDAYEVPYKLQGFRAYLGMHQQFMRTDFMILYAEVTEKNLLRKMSKSIDVAISLMATGFHLRDETVRKLSNYVRCVFLGTLAAAVEANKGQKLESGAQINERIGYQRGSEARSAILEAARICAFLTVDAEGNIDKEQGDFVLKIQAGRKPIRPSKSNLFTKDELEEISPLYPLGV